MRRRWQVLPEFKAAYMNSTTLAAVLLTALTRRWGYFSDVRKKVLVFDFALIVSRSWIHEHKHPHAHPRMFVSGKVPPPLGRGVYEYGSQWQFRESTICAHVKSPCGLC